MYLNYWEIEIPKLDHRKIAFPLSLSIFSSSWHPYVIEHFVVIDGHHLMYRAYYAIPRTFQTRKGVQTNAVYGVGSMLLSLLKIEEPQNLLFCFDAGEETFRHQENATYKEGRAETPDEFYLQIPLILRMIDAFGIRHVSDTRYEADDFLGTYARAAEGAGMRVSIVTGDRDAFQLATEHVRIAIPHKGYQQTEYLGPKEIEVKYGVRPDQIPSFKGLCGDASDNLPGVNGIGPKGAATLLQQFGSLANIYEHLSDIKPVIREKLERDREQAFFCEHMAILVCDIPLPISLAETALHEVETQAAKDFFNEIESPALGKRLDQILGTPYGKAHFKQEVQKEEGNAQEEKQLALF